jgi:hypothetical protein
VQSDIRCVGRLSIGFDVLMILYFPSTKAYIYITQMAVLPKVTLSGRANETSYYRRAMLKPNTAASTWVAFL